MPSAFSPLLRLTLPADGELVGTWGQVVNAGITSLEEAAIAGTAAIAMAAYSSFDRPPVWVLPSHGNAVLLTLGSIISFIHFVLHREIVFYPSAPDVL